MYNQARTLLEAGDEVLMITGEKGPEDRRFPGAFVDGLDYDRYQRSPQEEGKRDIRKGALRLADSLMKAMEAHWGQAADVVHVHNPLIQKNAALLPALNILRERGIRFLLQNHDLAEDFRPDVYTEEEYPENCHYAVINSRDYSFLHRAGLKVEGLHLLPNEVCPLEAAEGLPRTRYLYPVRAIRRKNIGEALLLSLFIPKGRTIAVTLPPNSGRDTRIYRFWTDLAEQLKLPVEFGIGTFADFSQIMGSSLGVITTSIKEGFGFSYLEPWTAGRAVIGRRLDYVCRDFEDAGVRFDPFYSAVNIPLVYISPAALRKKMDHALTNIYEAFGLDPPQYIIRMLNDEICSRDELDFGRLDEEFQEYLIRTLVSNDAVFRDIGELNPFLAGLADWKPDEDLIRQNRRIVLEKYGKERMARILRDAYREVGNPVVHRISKSMLLELYLDPLRLSLIEVGDG
jgi:glycosyltransferase involved in cell wall biosynthesis